MEVFGLGLDLDFAFGFGFFTVPPGFAPLAGKDSAPVACRTSIQRQMSLGKRRQIPYDVRSLLIG
jgi:hypothetical protein